MKRDSEQILTEWLVICAQSGDSSAMHYLLKKWHSRLMQYASRQIQDEEAAKDIVQETFISVCGSIGKLKDPASFPRWVYQILHRRGVDFLRKKARARRDEQIDDGFSKKTTDEERMATALDIREALRHLSRDSYELIHLHYLHGFNLNEIARITAVPIGTVKSRLHTARRQLKTLLGEKHE